MQVHNIRPQVIILLSTFNGSNFIGALLESLTTQSKVDIKILVRDDGSSDQTMDILVSYRSKMDMFIIAGENIGVDESFKKLIYESQKYNFDYVAFCDQDDIWLPDKLSRAIEQIKVSNKSHYSSKRLVFNKLQDHSKIFPKSNVSPNFKNSIFENSSAGCTTVIAREHYQTLIRLGCCEISGNFDHILSVMSIALREAYFDQESRINYRVHPLNSIGIVKITGRSFARTNQEICRKIQMFQQVIDHIGTEMTDHDYNFGIDVLGKRRFMRRIIWVLNLPKMRQRRHEDLFLKILLLSRNPRKD